VDFANRQIAVVESVEQMNGGVRIKEPKSGRARTVAFSGIVAEELRVGRIESNRQPNS